MSSLRHTLLAPALLLNIALSARAQDDITTRNAPSGYAGAYITGPASNPLSFLNGPAYRTFSSSYPYAIPDFAPVTLLDEQLPRWLLFSGEERLRAESGPAVGGTAPSDRVSHLLNRFRWQLTVRPVPWFRVVAQVQDARAVWEDHDRLGSNSSGPPDSVRWDLKLAYAEFGDAERQWISLRVGRQLISYNNTLIANSEWRNQGRSYDAAVVNLHYDRYRLGIFAASPVVPLAYGISHHQEGNNIYGLYGGIDKILPHSTLEPFVLWRTQPRVTVDTGSKQVGKQDEKAYGFRFKGEALRSVDYSYEAVRERGTDGRNGIHAWAQTGGAGYQIQRLWHARVFAQGDYASGDHHSADGVHNTFDTMYPTAHDRFGISDQFGWQNIVAARGGLTVEPRHRWTVTGQYLDFWLASSTDSLYNTSGGSIVRSATGAAGTHIGNEADAYTWFELNSHLNIGAGVAHLWSGRFLDQTTHRSGYTYPYIALNFKDLGQRGSR